MRLFISFLTGCLFGAGLLISGMTDTTKVQGWLDIFGDWDPTLAFVMGGAIIPMAVAWQFTKGRTPLAGDSFPEPSDPHFGRPLVVGSILFGAGWGLVGLCPGPVIASLSFGGLSGIVFLIAMLAGMALAPSVKSRLV